MLKQENIYQRLLNALHTIAVFSIVEWCWTRRIGACGAIVRLYGKIFRVMLLMMMITLTFFRRVPK